ncbi:MAG TPA: Xaa-Pro peptidase family protein [Pirellulales bacterium]|jgi:Xaa-Pro aminopeptidase|nr:Xaa-Pro peptidase family protein [Pirellulales bacterium]
MAHYELDLAACRGRQRRLLDEMQARQLDLVVVRLPEHVQWLSGVRFDAKFSPVAALSAEGLLTLVAPTKKGRALNLDVAADTIVPYEAQWLSTLRNDQGVAAAAALAGALRGKSAMKRIGVEFSACGPALLNCLPGAELIDIEPRLYCLRRRKDADELALLKKAIAGTGKMYELARQIVRPGITELEVFNQLQAAAVDEFGEMLTGTGNDYACAARGGPPRNRIAQRGELYILDLGPAFRGYFADNCRTLAVGGEPTDDQQHAWEQIAKVFPLVERTVRPGQKCRALFDEAAARLKECPLGTFDHHLGHGIGLYPHEAPHLNPNWDDTFAEGDVFACEPGLYGPTLNAGIRLENNYRVTSTGVELLSPFPLEL